MSSFKLQDHPVIHLRPRVAFPYSWVGHIPFAYLVMDLLRPATFVELGTDSGNSYFAFCQAVKKLDLPTRCWAVDTWQGDEQARHYSEKVYEAVLAYNNAHYRDFSSLKRSLFEDAVDDFADASIDLLHIDGLHTYDAVSADFESWLPKLSDHAVVLFHDSSVRQPGFGVARFVSEISERYPTFEFSHSNGLAVVAVGSQVSPAFQSFMEYANSHPESMRAAMEAVAGAILDVENGVAGNATLAKREAECRIYWDSAEAGFEAFSEQNSASIGLEEARGKQSIVFEGCESNIVALRIDPADSPGIFAINEIKMRMAGSEEVRHLSIASLAPGAISLAPADGELVRFAMLSSDPWVQLDLGSVVNELKAASSFRLEIEITFDMLVDDAVSSKLLERMQGQIATDAIKFDTRDSMQESWIRNVDERLAASNELLRSRQDQLAAMEAVIGSLVERQAAASEDVNGQLSRLANDTAVAVEGKWSEYMRLVDDKLASVNGAVALVTGRLERLEGTMLDKHSDASRIRGNLAEGIAQLRNEMAAQEAALRATSDSSKHMHEEMLNHIGTIMERMDERERRGIWRRLLDAARGS